MKRALAALLLVASSGTAAQAVQVNSVITDSVQLTVEGAAVQTRRIGSTYSVSGTNVSASTLGGLNHSQASPTNPATLTAGSYSVTNAGDPFTFTESATIGDTPVTAQQTASNNGRFNAPVLYGDSTTSIGGTAGTLAGQLGGNHGGSLPSVTAGGPGTTAIAQRTVELSVFR